MCSCIIPLSAQEAVVERRHSPVPPMQSDTRQSLVAPEVAEMVSPPKPPRSPHLSASSQSPPRSPKAPPRPPSIRAGSLKSGSLPPPRPPPPTKKPSETEIIINYPTSPKTSLTSPTADTKGGITRSYSPSPSPGSSRGSSPTSKARGSVRSSKTYNPELNPFGDDLEDEDEDNAEDKTDTTPLVAGQQTPPTNRPSLNPFLSASIKKKMAPNPPAEQKSVSNIEKKFPKSVNEGQRSGRVKVEGSPGSEGSGGGDEGDMTVTSGAANESATSVSDASPVVIVSVCLK